jgi:hypothetical protein
VQIFSIILGMLDIQYPLGKADYPRLIQFNYHNMRTDGLKYSSGTADFIAKANAFVPQDQPHV